MKVLYLLLLLVGTVFDIREKMLPVTFLAFGGAVGLAWVLGTGAGDFMGIAGGLAIGGVILVTGKLTAGGIGSGDGFFLMVSGFYLSFLELILMLGSGLFLAVFYGVMRYKKGRSYPFLPFLLAGYLCMEVIL